MIGVKGVGIPGGGGLGILRGGRYRGADIRGGRYTQRGSYIPTPPVTDI